VALDAASGLSAAWDEGLVHADVKPENILFDKSGRAKLIDFGLAIFAHSQGEVEGVWGTPYYTSPERLRSEQLDLRSDIYSLGATLYHALTGRPPHDGDSVRAICQAKLGQDVVPPSKYRRGLLPETDALVCRMLRCNPKERYPTYASLISDMRKALQLAAVRPATAVAKDGRILYTAKAGFTGTDSFAYTVTYPSGRSSTATVAVAVGVEAATVVAATSSTGQTDTASVAMPVTGPGGAAATACGGGRGIVATGGL